jgi:hypothetical protein
MKRERQQGAGSRAALGKCSLLVVVAVVAAAGLAVGFGGSALADPKADFEQFPAGTALGSQYADLGGAGQGVVFGPLPAGAPGEGLRPVVRTPPAGQAQSGSKVADIATCVGCEFFTPRTTGTFGVPRSRVSVYVGYLGEPAICTSVDPNGVGCGVVRLRAFDRDGKQVAESSVRATRGAGVHSQLSVSTQSATIVGFELSGRPAIDDSKPIAIDDLSFGSPAAPKPTPDFTLNPAVINVILEQGGSATDAITIGRLNGSTGGVAFSAEGLPAGIEAGFAPDPASGSQTVLTLTAAANAPAARRTISVTGTPQSASAGPSPRSFTIDLVVQPSCPHVGTAQELIDKLVKGHKCVYVEDKARIDLAAVPDNPLSDDESVLVIPDGVMLMGGRSPTVLGGMLELSHRIAKRIMLKLGSNTRVAGLRLRGYNERDRKGRNDPTRAIAIFGKADVLIENNEIFGWPSSGVDVRDTPARRSRIPQITRNFFHNNVQCNLGYGVVVGGNGFARIDRNLFNYNRHDVAGAGDPGDGYVAELNFTLTSGPKCDPGDTFQHYNQQYDMHGLNGVAGDLIEIRRNTIRGAQGYAAGFQKRPAFWLRGTPEFKAIFVGNAVAHGKALDQHTVEGKTISSKGAVRVSGTSVISLLRKKKLVIAGNRTCVDTAHELAVGDFNGDRRADVFQAVGTLWVYSPSGQREWFFLRDSNLRLGSLALGDFDGDGRTDVFFRDGARWLVSSGGTSAPTPRPVGASIDMKQLRFGDFDRDGKTDVFLASGSRFFFSSGGAAAWQPLAASRLKIGDLRFGDFDGDGRTDVFSLVNNQWSVSDGGQGAWRRLNRKLSSDLGSLVFADFDGDRKTDVARTSGGKWQVSRGGATDWQTLQFGRSEPLSIGMLFGDFDGDGRADVLQHGAKSGLTLPACWAPKKFLSFQRFRLSSGGARPLANWSSADIR